MKRVIAPALTLLIVGWSGIAGAGSVKGKITLPSQTVTEPATKRLFWKVPNGILPIARPIVDPRQRMVVILKDAAAPKTVETVKVTLRDSQFEPPALAVAPGARVEFKNQGGELHLLESSDGQLIKGQGIGPNESKRFTFPAAGRMTIQCTEIPHVRLYVTISPHVSAGVDRTGAFRIPNLAAGQYTLVVYYEGREIRSQSIAVRGRTPVTVRLRPNDLVAPEPAPSKPTAKKGAKDAPEGKAPAEKK